MSFSSMRELFNRVARHMDRQGHHDLADAVRDICERWSQRAQREATQ